MLSLEVALGVDEVFVEALLAHCVPELDRHLGLVLVKILECLDVRYFLDGRFLVTLS